MSTSSFRMRIIKNASSLKPLYTHSSFVNSLDPHEGVVELWINGLQVVEGQRLVEDALVKWQ